MSNVVKGVYCLTSPSGKRYVGIGLSKGGIKARWNSYRKHRANEQPLLHAALEKYGPDSFKYEVILETDDREKACAVERQLIALWGCQIRSKGYNILSGGDGWIVGTRHSDETKKKLSVIKAGKTPWKAVEASVAARKGKKLSEAHKEKLKAAKAVSTYIMSEETRHKRSLASKGHKRNVGHKVSQETRVKISESNKGKKLSPESIAKRQATRMANGGYRLSDEARNKISEAGRRRRGEKRSAEARANVSLSLIGNKNRLGGNKYLSSLSTSLPNPVNMANLG